eukprot:3351600-Rhodomonas_salina.1
MSRVQGSGFRVQGSGFRVSKLTRASARACAEGSRGGGARKRGQILPAEGDQVPHVADPPGMDICARFSRPGPLCCLSRRARGVSKHAAERFRTRDVASCIVCPVYAPAVSHAICRCVTMQCPERRMKNNNNTIAAYLWGMRCPLLMICMVLPDQARHSGVEEEEEEAAEERGADRARKEEGGGEEGGGWRVAEVDEEERETGKRAARRREEGPEDSDDSDEAEAGLV